MFQKGRIVIALGAALCALFPSAAAAQLAGSSGIAGVARDTSGAILPGVTVEASSPALIEQTRSVVTDGQGRYSIVELRPGVYTVSFTLPGFSTVRREGVELGPNFTATVNAEMRVGALEETITVRSESPVVDVLRVESRNVISQEALETLPTNKTLPAFVALTPGLVAAATSQDVGGSKGEVFIQPAIHGGRSTEARTVLDGFETNSPDVSGSGRVFVPNPASTQAVSVELGDGPGDSPSSGVAINFVPRDGGNRFTGTMIGNFSHDSLQGTNVSSELESRGVNASSIGGLDRIWDTSIGVGGPINRDRIWFFTSYRYWGSANRVPNQFYSSTPTGLFYTKDESRPALDDFTNRHYNVRVTWQASQRNKFNISWDNQYRCDCHRSVSATLAPEATAARIYRPDIITATWSFPMTSRLLFEAGSATSRLDYSPTPQDFAAPDGISITEQSNSLTYRAVPSSAGESTGLGQKYSLTQNSRFSMTYVTGSHNFKTGMTMRNMTRSYHNEGAGINYRFNNQRPNQVTLYAYPLVFHEVLKADVGLFVQDQWTIDRLTLNMALRYDYLNAYVPAQVHPAGPFIGERNFGEVTCVPCWNDISPRISAAYNLFGNGKTALKVSVGKYMAQELLTLATANNPISASNPTATRSWSDDGDFIPEEPELGPLSNSRFGTVFITTRYEDEILRDNRQFNWKYSAGIQHELLPRTAVGFSYFRTTWHNFRVTQNLANTPADYDPYSFTAPLNADLPGGGGYLVDGLYNISQAKFGLVDNVVKLASHFGKQEEVYDGVDLTVNSRLPGGTFVGGGFNTGRTRTSECFVVNSPQALRFCENNPPFRTQLKLNGAYSLPWELKASAVFQSIPGVAYNANYTASNALIQPSLGRPLSGGAANVTVNLIEANSQFEDRIIQLDFRFSRTFPIGNGRIQAMFDVYNALNGSAILAVNNTYGNSWRSPSGILDARLFKFGVQYDF
jgi:hypothetical protein